MMGNWICAEKNTNQIPSERKQIEDAANKVNAIDAKNAPAGVATPGACPTCDAGLGIILPLSARTQCDCQGVGYVRRFR